MSTRSVIASAVSLTLMYAAQVRAAESTVATDADTGDSLEEIVVEGAYMEAGASSAMKLDVAVRDTPYSVSAYSEAFMEQIESTNVADLYKYMTGIQKAGGTAYDMTIRGFKTDVNDRNALMIDGLPGLVSRHGSPPTIGTERIEVVKGPASVLYGQAQPGGFVNLITKKPKKEASGEILVKGVTFASDDRPGFGDNNGYSVAFDSTGPIDDGGRVLYRFVAEKTEDLNSWRDNTFNDGVYAAPSLTWNITESTSATVRGEYRKAKGSYDRGLVAPNKDASLIADRTTRYQEPGDYQEEEGKTASLSVTHWFENGVTLNFSGRYVETEDDSRGHDNLAVRPDGVTLTRRASWLSNERTSQFYDANVVLPFDTGPVSHKMIVGAGGGYDTARLTRNQFFNGPATGPQSLNINIYNPIYGVSPDPSTLPLGNLTDRYNETSALGVYVADLMTLSEHWKLNVGARSSNEDQKITNMTTMAPATEKKEDKVLPMVGLLFQPTKEWTIYTSYSTSFVPAAASAQDINGENPFGPEYATQIEVGAKAELFEGRLQPTLAVFEIEKEDVVSGFSCPPNVPASGTCSVQIGAQRSRGVEFELNTRPIDNLQIVAGIAHFKADVTESIDPAQVGARIPNTAEDNIHLWARYDFTGVLDGFGTALGVSYTGDRVGNLPTSTDARVMQFDAYSVVDLGFYYATQRFDFALKVSNLLDEDYIESSGVTPEVQLQMGTPRQVTLSMRTHF